jgi:hypothetical protein
MIVGPHLRANFARRQIWYDIGEPQFLEAPISTAAVVFTEPKLLIYKELRRHPLGWPEVGRCCSVARLFDFKEKAVHPRESLLL